MAIIYNGTIITAVEYNDTVLDKVYYNDVEVFSAGPPPTPDEYFIFTEMDDGTYEIKAKDATSMPDDVVLPNTYNGKPVTKISQKAFYVSIGVKPIRSVIIPDNITTIGRNAFYACNNLTSVKIGKGVTNIEFFAFSACTSLTEVTIPGNVKTLGGQAFGSCTKLTNVIIEDGVQTIDTYAFADDDSLTIINIPASVTTLGKNPFGRCNKLSAVVIDEANPNYKSIYGTVYTKNGDTLISFPAGKDQTSFIVEDGVKTIDNYAIAEATKLNTITLPSSLTEIGIQPFQGCTNMSTLNVKAEVPPTLASNALSGLPTNCNIYVPSSAVGIYRGATGWSDRASYIQSL